MNERSRAILFVTLGLWTVHWALFTISNALDGNPQTLTRAVARIGVSLIGVSICYGILSLLKRLRLRTLRSRAIALAVVSPVAGEIYAWITYFALNLATGQPIHMAMPSWTSAVTFMSLYAWLFFAWASLVFAIEFSFDRRDDELRLAEYKSIAQAAKLRALHSQINPHFLFNSLNSLSSLILDRRIEDADLMVTRLANFFRLSLAADPLADIPLCDEIRLQREYLAIEQARYPDLKVDVLIPPELERARVPALLLQPLIENAVKHGVSRSAAAPRIAVGAKSANGRLDLFVENFGGKPDRKIDGAGMGLAYVRERLESRFGDAQALAAGPLEEDGYRVSISIPLSR